MTKARRKIDVLARRDGWVCHLCGEPINPQARRSKWRATLDHLIPRSHGGTVDLRNMRLAHSICNMKRGDDPLVYDDWRDEADSSLRASLIAALTEGTTK